VPLEDAGLERRSDDPTEKCSPELGDGVFPVVKREGQAVVEEEETSWRG